MAQPKLNLTGSFITQILFGLFLTLVFLMTGYDQSLSIFLGVLGGIALGWMTAVQKTGPKQPEVAVSEGIDAGLKYWLFFLLAFVFVGYKPPMGILLGAIAGIGGGWIIAWWETKEQSRTQIPNEIAEDVEGEGEGEGEGIGISARPNKRQIRRSPRRVRRRPGSINLKFWER
ncbi:MAG: hypothetical protein SAK29_23645 [Scytonema sp. PMC 1069.18]|nr:hypothetical protein [Scytonema sp. PMC 1069.18]MEC4884093.1 hypothetical protein [Scytonema sp. PMC 1070.18]